MKIPGVNAIGRLLDFAHRQIHKALAPASEKLPTGKQHKVTQQTEADPRLQEIVPDTAQTDSTAFAPTRSLRPIPTAPSLQADQTTQVAFKGLKEVKQGFADETMRKNLHLTSQVTIQKMVPRAGPSKEQTSPRPLPVPPPRTPPPTRKPPPPPPRGWEKIKLSPEEEQSVNQSLTERHTSVFGWMARQGPAEAPISREEYLSGPKAFFKKSITETYGDFGKEGMTAPEIGVNKKFETTKKAADKLAQKKLKTSHPKMEMAEANMKQAGVVADPPSWAPKLKVVLQDKDLATAFLGHCLASQRQYPQFLLVHALQAYVELQDLLREDAKETTKTKLAQAVIFINKNLDPDRVAPSPLSKKISGLSDSEQQAIRELFKTGEDLSQEDLQAYLSLLKPVAAELERLIGPEVERFLQKLESQS